MTREEAIKELSVEYLGDSEKIREAKRMAIEALAQQPCEDCISREAMWKVVHECETHNSPSWVWREMLSQLPSVQPTRPTGKWIDVGVEGLVFKCSLCGDKNTIESHYCPNCGARMEESEEQA